MARIDVIERADALDALRDVPERSVGLLLTDPPYSSGGLFRGDRSGTTSSKYQTAGFAAKPDFYGDNRDERSLVLWSSMWMGLAFRALEPGASALVFTDWRQWANTADAMQVAGFVFRGAVVWHKAINLRPQPNSFRSECEFALWFTKGAIDRTPSAGAKYLPGLYSVPAPRARGARALDPEAPGAGQGAHGDRAGGLHRARPVHGQRHHRRGGGGDRAPLHRLRDVGRVLRDGQRPGSARIEGGGGLNG